MRNLIFGAVGVLWGGGVLVYSFAGDRPQGDGAYRAGQLVGTLFGLLLFGAGLYYLVVGVRSLNEDREEDEEPRPKKKRKKKKRPARDEE